MAAHDPHLEYMRRLEERLARGQVLERRHVQFGNWRLALVAVAAALVWLAFWRDAISGWWLLVPAAVFAGLAVAHQRVLERRACAERASTFYRHGLERLNNQWAGKGEAGDRFADPSHPYAEDLDLFGRGSIFELLCAARTRMGENTLASWLLNPAAPHAVRARHAAIAELTPNLDLREDVAIMGEDARAGVHPEALARWSESAPLLVSRKERALATVLPAATAAGLVLWAATGFASLFAAALFVQFYFRHRLRGRVMKVVSGAEHAAHDLSLLSEILARFERESFQSELLAGLRTALESDHQPPSKRIARLNRLAELIESRDNVLMRVIDPLILWTEQLAFAAEAWRIHSGAAVRKWLDAVGEIEALSSLAAYAYEHPEDSFPELIDGPALFDAAGLAHPLLSARAVCNDVRLDGDVRLLIVSGSNMSGKSTLLRSIGAAVVMAMAGAPVRATRLALSPLCVGASIRVIDSIQAGSSRFYAEIKRIRMLLDMARGPVPLLFLLDELLHGTNSHDRRIGAEAIVRGLMQRNAIGLVTTHDLALAEIADQLRPPAVNVHFEDQIENGRIHFDYKLRPGVVNKSNAIELMRSIGLEV